MHMLVKTAAVAAIGVVAWKAWQRYRATSPVASLRDGADITPPHGDPRVPAVTPDLATTPRVASQSSRGFGGDA
jgi:uncharacterized membrane protein YebE (DUF533 family)